MDIKFNFEKIDIKFAEELQKNIISFLNKKYNNECNYFPLSSPCNNFIINNINNTNNINIEKFVNELGNKFNFNIEKLKDYGSFIVCDIKLLDNNIIHDSNNNDKINNISLKGNNSKFEYNFKNRESLIKFFNVNNLHDIDDFYDMLNFAKLGNGESILIDKNISCLIKLYHEGEYNYYFVMKNNNILINDKIYNESKEDRKIINNLLNEYNSYNYNNEDIYIKSI